MKKIISFILVLCLASIMFSVPTYATSEWKYYDTAKEYAFDYFIDGYCEFIHYSEENSEVPDWVLMRCIIMPEQWEKKYGTAVGDRILYVVGRNSIGGRLDYGYTVYIVETDTFIDLTKSNLEQIIELCPQFEEFVKDNEIGQLFGDVNDNGELDIVDATLIQRCLAGFEDEEMIVYDKVEGCGYVSDFNRDGERNILDATTIQKKLAKIEI